MAGDSRIHRTTAALLDDLLRDYARAERKPAADPSAAPILSGMLVEVVDVVRHAMRQLAALEKRAALGKPQLDVLLSGARQAIVLAVELEREDEAARRRALGDRTTAPAAPAGSFRAPRRAQPPPLPKRGAVPPPPPAGRVPWDSATERDTPTYAEHADRAARKAERKKR